MTRLCSELLLQLSLKKTSLQGSWSLIQNMNPGAATYKAKMLSTTPWCSNSWLLQILPSNQRRVQAFLYYHA